jgi:prepilin-type N-terminal cleavage/methylation domain-containing protein/prepilin-type processing-associated H-X9-DG protein
VPGDNPPPYLVRQEIRRNADKAWLELPNQHQSRLSACALASSMPRSGFTLIELLVVISIIALLCTLLIPTLVTAKSKGHSVVCSNNARQLAFSYHVAVDNNNGRILGESWDDGTEENLRWKFVREYSRTGSSSSICPVAPARPMPVNFYGMRWGALDYAWDYRFFEQPVERIAPYEGASSYSLNGFFAANYSIEGPLSPECFQRNDQIPLPASTPLVGDGTSVNDGLIATSLPPRNLLSESSFSGFCVPRHGSRPRTIPTDHPPEEKLPGAVNIAFYDGHVEQVPLERLWFLNWHKDYVAPEKRPGLR